MREDVKSNRGGLAAPELDEGGEKFFLNSFVYFAWFAVNLPRHAGEMCADKKLNMNDVFILGAGFSKAISSEMPIVKGGELSKEVLKAYKFRDSISVEIRRMIEENFENALDFLASHKPWLSESENQRHRAIYLELTYVIRAVFWCKRKVWDSPPFWFEELIAYWHNNRCAVISLNYDLLIECLASTIYSHKQYAIPTADLYPIRFTQVTPTNGLNQAASHKIENPIETFRLFKLHGSINWFYSGRANFFGEELFCIPCSGEIDRFFDDADKTDWRRLSGKCPLIVPPTSDKSGFFQHEALRSMWFQAGEAIRRASRVICFGYSLPDSDLTMAQFLRSCAPPSRIGFEIVDLAERDKCESKIEHFTRIVGTGLYDFRQGYSGGCCILKFVKRELVTDPKDKR